MKTRSLIISSVLLLTVFMFSVVHAQPSDSESDTHYVLGRYFYSEPTIDDQIFSISSKTINGSIDNVYQNVGDAGINFSIESSSSGFLHVEIPRNYPYSNSFFDPFVVVNDKEKGLGSDYTLNEAECFYEYEIPFTGDSLIEILFGQIAVDEPFVSEIIPLQCIEETIVDDDSIVVDISYLSPLDQFESGKKIEKIQCKFGLDLIERTNGKPACVKPETKIKLIERDWIKNECARLVDSNMVKYSNHVKEQKEKDVTWSSPTPQEFLSKSEYFEEWKNNGCYDTIKDWRHLSENFDLVNPPVLNKIENEN